MVSSRGYRVLTALILAVLVVGTACADSMWVMDMQSCITVRRYSVSGVGPEQSLVVPGSYDCARGVAGGAGQLWVLGRLGCRFVSVVDPATAGVNAVITVDNGLCGYTIAYGDGSLWVQCDGVRIDKVDPATGHVTRSINLPVMPSIAHIAYGGGFLWVVDGGSCAQIRKIDPSSGAVLQTLAPTATNCISALTYGDGHLWAAGIRGSRKVSKINPADGSTVSVVDFGTGMPISALAYQENASPPPTPVTISEAKTASSGANVAIESAITTARFTDHAYVESADRSSGIRIVGSRLPARGEKVDISGTIETVSGEKSLRASTLSVVGTEQADPLGMSIRSIASYGPNAGALHALGTTGLCNTGLLVRTWGRVTGHGSGFFYVDDGVGVKDGTGFTGLRVLCDGQALPALDKRVQLTGISTLFPNGSSHLPAVHLRDPADLRVLN